MHTINILSFFVRSRRNLQRSWLTDFFRSCRRHGPSKAGSTQQHFRAFSLSLSLFLPFVCSRHVYPRIGSKARQIFEPSSATCRSKRYGLSTPYLRSAGPSPGRRDSQKYCFSYFFLNQHFRKPAARWTGRGSTLLKHAVLKKIQVRLTKICLWPTPNTVLLRCHRFSAANGDFLTDRVFAAIE